MAQTHKHSVKAAETHPNLEWSDDVPDGAADELTALRAIDEETAHSIG